MTAARSYRFLMTSTNVEMTISPSMLSELPRVEIFAGIGFSNQMQLTQYRDVASVAFLGRE